MEANICFIDYWTGPEPGRKFLSLQHLLLKKNGMMVVPVGLSLSQGGLWGPQPST